MPTPIVLIRNSERATFKRCRQKWHWAYELGLEPKRRKGALTFGTLMHACMEGYYPPGVKRGPHPAEIFEHLWRTEYLTQFDQWDEEGNNTDAFELGMQMCRGYVERYGKDPDIEIIQPEQPFQVDVYDRDGKYLATLVGRFDAIGRNRRTGRLFVFEHKTGKSIELVRVNSGYGEQGLAYWFAANHWARENGILKPGQVIDGVLYNWLRKGMPNDTKARNPAGHLLNKPSKDRLKQECEERGLPVKGTVEVLTERLTDDGCDVPQLGEIAKVQPSPLYGRQELLLDAANLNTFQKRLRREAVEMARVRERRQSIYKNPTKDCGWECPFVEACEVHEMGGDYKGILEFEFKPWDPYSDHELEAEKA